MQKKYTDGRAYGLLEHLLLHSERRKRNRRCRDGVNDFIGLLANYIRHKPMAEVAAPNLLYRQFSNHFATPCGYAIRIAIEKLPGKISKKSKK